MACDSSETASRADAQLKFDHAELISLRREMLLRIAIQNGLLLLVGPLLLAAIIAEIALPRSVGLVTLGFLVATGAMSLIWCHHGVRQAQLKAYLMLLEARMSATGGWESWLPRHRLGGWLGSRWFISTKGVFLGSQIAAVVSAVIVGAGRPLLWLPAAIVLVAGTAFFLLVNPKEGVEHVQGR